MRTIKLFIVALAVSLAFGGVGVELASAQAQEAVTKTVTAKGETLGVSTIKATDALEAVVKNAGKTIELSSFTQSFDGTLIERINASRKFQIVGRNDVNINAIIKEQDLGRSGNVESKSSAKIGMMKGAKYVLVAALDDFQDRTRVVKLDADRQTSIRSLRVSALVKIYDSTSGTLLEASTQTITNSMNRNLNSATLADEGPDTEQMLAQASRKMADQIVQYVVDVIYPAKVVSIAGGLITINRGEGTNIKRGQIWTVYATGEEMIDPDTGESLGAEETPICKAVVTAVKPKVSTLKIQGEDLGVEKGMILRPASKDDFNGE